MQIKIINIMLDQHVYHHPRIFLPNDQRLITKVRNFSIVLAQRWTNAHFYLRWTCDTGAAESRATGSANEASRDRRQMNALSRLQLGFNYDFANVTTSYLNCRIISSYRVAFCSCNQGDERGPVKLIQDSVADPRNFPRVTIIRVTIINANGWRKI